MVVLAALSLAYWTFVLIVGVLVRRNVPQLASLERPAPAHWPKLSVIIPACNEGLTLEAAMNSKLAEGYPNLELVLIDDRSTDDTGAIVDKMAAADSRVTAVHITTLPEAWLGKLHAMHVGAQRATGEYLLFSDADIHFHPGALSKAISLCEADGLGHLAVMPELWPAGLLLDSMMAFFTRFISLVARMWQVNSPRSRAAVGVGAFNLVRRDAFAKTAGFEWLKLETGDDMALGQMMKRSGAKTMMAWGVGTIALKFYESFGAVARSLEKNTPTLHFSLILGTLFAGFPVFLELAFMSGFAAPGVPRLLACAALAIALVACQLYGPFTRIRPFACFASLFASIPMAVAVMRAVVVSKRRGGMQWRGTVYPAKQLIEGRRLDFP